MSRSDYFNGVENSHDESSLNHPRKKGGIVKSAVAAFALLTGMNSMYVVNQTEQAVVTQFGSPQRVILNLLDNPDREEIATRLNADYASKKVSVSEGAGLHFKLPYIQSVAKFDRRLQRWDGFPEQIPTRDKRFIWVDITARYAIEDPLKFLKTVGPESQAHGRLDEVVDSVVRDSITKRNLIEVVRADNREMQITEEELRETLPLEKVGEGRSKIVAEISRDAAAVCLERYGIKIHDDGVLIRNIAYVDEVRAKVEDRMISERTRISAKYLSEGEGEYQKIMGDKERELKTISSEAFNTAKDIEGKADAEATRIYAESYNKSPEFYNLSRTLQLYESGLGKRTRVVARTDSPLFEFMSGKLPDFKNISVPVSAPINPAAK